MGIIGSVFVGLVIVYAVAVVVCAIFWPEPKERKQWWDQWPGL